MTLDPHQKIPFVTCPTCSGSGLSESGFKCKNCSGSGLGAFYYGKFYYWGINLGVAVIELSHLKKKFNKTLNLSSLLLGVTGLISMGIWIFITGQSNLNSSDFYFWKIQHPLLLGFWMGIGFLMFYYYRDCLEQSKQHKIKKVKYQEQITNSKAPNNWEELKSAKSKFKIEVSSGFGTRAMNVVEQSFLLASKLHHKEVTPLHLFFISLGNSEVAAIFSRLNVDADKLISKIKEHISKLETGTGKVIVSNELKEVLVNSYLEANRLELIRVDPKNFIVSCIMKNELLREILYDFEVNETKVNNVIMWFIINKKQVENYKNYRHAAKFKPKTNMDRAYTSMATPILNQVTYDLTLAARSCKLEFCVAREKEIEQIWQNFESGANGAMLVGPTGVGKNSIIGGIAQLMVKEDVPKFLQDKRLVEMDASRLISGATPAQAQGRMMAIIDELIRAGNIVLYINNIEDLIGITSGGEESLDLSEIIASSVERGDFYCLASATSENYINHIEGKSLAEAMTKINISEPIGDQAIQIIESKIAHFEGKYKVYFSYNAIESVIDLSVKYIHEKYLPEKAINILELVAVKVSKTKGAHAIVSREDIAVVIGEKTGIPVSKISETESEKLLNLEKKIHERMIGQKQAVSMISSSLRRARTELREGKRPIANFLFLGPTGVGKTELAKTVAETYFGDEDYMIRLDMSEYQHPDSVKKMIGDAQGTSGYLTEAVRKSPFSLVLLDELEKAHPDILNLFLQVMDDGRLTDGQGRTIDFTNSIIIATSNAGAAYIQEQVLAGTAQEDIKRTLINEYLIKVMRPEFINRFDGVIVFEPLTLENIRAITKLMLRGLEKMLNAKGINLKIDDNGLTKLAQLGYDPKFGARPLRRLIQERIEDAIANKILMGELKRRDTVLINPIAEVKVVKGIEI